MTETEKQYVRWKLQSSCGMAAARLLIKAFDGDVKKALDFFYDNAPEDHEDIHDFFDALHVVLFQLVKTEEHSSGDSENKEPLLFKILKK
ncbi:MAG: hypothetical protein AAFZ15_24945 [Bacteroidota bacterium]